ncbi:hypothetical protein BFW01_g11481 [Lasiodiplodia theobromae]|uniref:Uncharacterized protein n=1 Tax=Lasiodiplodia theobromae TaxID=45133 RepID=A0A5N5DNC6_9PEZI|nr:uncharacterized protein LTHEOB_1548 [Lasiodiplodia theobromae]KAB2579110.1 hypothetical protein DBV05_g2160 [Lasiodiplodia theobromae]KAF4537357.1 hypothetical protein LTHEOB_1548 [Lasiodiplodia theobromae]KAF9639675.1 hypothetical protein BFW01_g11481 [Lasiodiplodia theobromae]
MSSSPDLLRTALAPCTTYAFDLDDTLHSFRAASSAAATAVFEYIVASTNTENPTLLHQPGDKAAATTTIDVPRLRALYATILKAKTANAFADGATRTSDDYRKERFAALLHAAGLSLADPPSPSPPSAPSSSPSPNDATDELELESSPYLTALAATYKTALRASLALKPGAAPLLRALKARPGRRVVVVTEGPRDAQLWTLRELGLLKETGGFVDEVVTTGDVGRAKVEEGFWGEVLRRVGGGDRVLRAEEVAVVGDSWERDVVPAREAGCVVVWYCEGGGDGAGAGEGRDGVLRVDALDRLREAVETESGV